MWRGHRLSAGRGTFAKLHDDNEGLLEEEALNVLDDEGVHFGVAELLQDLNLSVIGELLLPWRPPPTTPACRRCSSSWPRSTCW